jgi:hypothetical protein
MKVSITNSSTEFLNNIANYDAMSDAEQREYTEEIYERHSSELPFRADTVINVGRTGIIMTLSTEEERNKNIDIEFDAAIEALKPLAEPIIRALLNGDTSALRGMPDEWVNALSARASTRLREYGDAGSIPRSEVDGMISVAAIGLAKAKYGMDFGNHQA